jgi:hypothetical protein
MAHRSLGLCEAQDRNLELADFEGTGSADRTIGLRSTKPESGADHRLTAGVRNQRRLLSSLSPNGVWQGASPIRLRLRLLTLSLLRAPPPRRRRPPEEPERFMPAAASGVPGIVARS